MIEEETNPKRCKEFKRTIKIVKKLEEKASVCTNENRKVWV